MRRLSVITGAVAIVCSSALLAGLAAPAQAAREGEYRDISGSIDVTVNAAAQAQLLKTGLSLYGEGDVLVEMGGSGRLIVRFPLAGRAVATNRVLQMDPRSRGLLLLNGPGNGAAEMDALHLQTVGTPVVSGRIVPPATPIAGHWPERMRIFTVSSMRRKVSGLGWGVEGNLILTGEAASALNSLTNSSAFTAGMEFGSLDTMFEARR